ncbi:VCBS domain-containing protein, partial [Legionella norrlandica]|uniref:VCBS domain-containing protein n=1 Tax=Legionella norrlandica TaxID=1498499 RepID=UPI000562FF50
MLIESIIGIVRAVNGLLEKVNAQGEAKLVKAGAQLQEGDILTLLSGEAYIQFIKGFPEALALGKPIKLDGVSPILKGGLEDINEELVKEALAKGLDPSLILDVLGAPAAGQAVLGSGGETFILDPRYLSGNVSSGFETHPINLISTTESQQLYWFVPETEVSEIDKPNVRLAESISGIAQGTVIEPGSSNPGVPQTSGKLTSTSEFIEKTVSGNLGTFKIDKNGNWSYALHDNSEVDKLKANETFLRSFEAATADGSTYKIDVTIKGTNDAPTARDDIQATNEDIPLSGNVLTNDSDVDNDRASLAVTQFIVNINGALRTYNPGEKAIITGIGELTINSDGAYTFIPEPNYNGDVPLITYTVSDGNDISTAILSIRVIPVIDTTTVTLSSNAP